MGIVRLATLPIAAHNYLRTDQTTRAASRFTTLRGLAVIAGNESEIVVNLTTRLQNGSLTLLGLAKAYTDFAQSPREERFHLRPFESVLRTQIAMLAESQSLREWNSYSDMVLKEFVTPALRAFDSAKLTQLIRDVAWTTRTKAFDLATDTPACTVFLRDHANDVVYIGYRSVRNVLRAIGIETLRPLVMSMPTRSEIIHFRQDGGQSDDTVGYCYGRTITHRTALNDIIEVLGLPKEPTPDRSQLLLLARQYESAVSVFRNPTPHLDTMLPIAQMRATLSDFVTARSELEPLSYWYGFPTIALNEFVGPALKGLTIGCLSGKLREHLWSNVPVQFDYCNIGKSEIDRREVCADKRYLGFGGIGNLLNAIGYDSVHHAIRYISGTEVYHYDRGSNRWGRDMGNWRILDEARAEMGLPKAQLGDYYQEF